MTLNTQPLPLPGPGTLTSPDATDLRIVYAAGITLALLGAGILMAFSVRLGFFTQYSFSSLVAMVYVPVGSIIILSLGWSSRYFAVAASVFFGFLPISQATNDTWFLAGDDKGAITADLLLAVPLILTGVLGPVDPQVPRRPLPPLVHLGWGLILATGLISTVLALDPAIAAWTYLARFVIPVLVVIATWRRLRGFDDFKILSFTFILGQLAIAGFGFMRSMESSETIHQVSGTVGQRYAGLSVGAAIPAMWVMGLALWNARARATELSIVRPAFWLGVAALMPVLFWFGGHRLPIVFAAFITLIWLPRSLGTILARPMMVLPLAIAGVVALLVVRYSVESTSLDALTIVDRFKELLGSQGNNRAEVWAIGMDGFLRSPIWGLGLNQCVVVNAFYGNLHSSILAALFDVGVLGVGAFFIMLFPILRMRRRELTYGFSQPDRDVFNGHLITWCLLQVLMLVNLAVTSGNPKNNIVVYLTFMYPLLAMTLYSRSRAPITTWTLEALPGAWPTAAPRPMPGLPGDAVALVGESTPSA